MDESGQLILDLRDKGHILTSPLTEGLANIE